ncbi:dehydrodolichyl diphosphate synthase 2 [Ricinus communis]|uniref:Alkyl transferase n=1 Tax=Ricinus communis TaxID=3988 RepID=B9SI16_RICCO|nr:dehydrodolichyl diphosphate synthase 2 [Ricinus communis]EEF36753.1 undecaprenyl pyrophosphate synthetase, putative [Ricinus communis]|eukprot:XP_002525635.1 dehydrodolichyl diphosphate synthase 2 [Ricinus communis]
MQALQLNLPLSIYNNTLTTPQTPKTFPSRNQSRPLHGRFAPLLATNTDVAVIKQADIATTSTSDDPEPLPDGLLLELMPRHVAVIMDGNGRWAKQQGWPPSKGHEAGVRSLMEIMNLCGHWGIKVLTVFAFSCENWTRPKVEIDFLMSLFERVLKSELENLLREGIRVSIIGDVSKLPESLQRLIREVEDTTKDYSKLHLLVAVSYSGKYDVVKACRNIAGRVKEGAIEPEDISEDLIEQELETNCSEHPSPDLLIRTSGELRISNFLLWQLAYTELYFAEELWPDFGKDGFVEALTSFQQRQRRYGQRK